MKKRNISNRLFQLVPGYSGILATCFKERENKMNDELLSLFTSFEEERRLGLLCETSDAFKTKKLLQDETVSGLTFEEELDLLRAENSSGSRKRSKGSTLDDGMTSKLQGPERWTVIPLGDVHCMSFLRVPVDSSPLECCYRIWKELQTTGVVKTKYTQRLIPVEFTCTTQFDDIQKTIHRLLDAHPELFSPLSTSTTDTLSTSCDVSLSSFETVSV
jgi:hypothetical protein